MRGAPRDDGISAVCREKSPEVMGGQGLYAAEHFSPIYSGVTCFCFWSRRLPGWDWLEIIVPALFFAPGVVQHLDGEQLTADDLLSKLAVQTRCCS